MKDPTVRYVLIHTNTLSINTFETYYDYLMFINNHSGQYIYLDFRLCPNHTKFVTGKKNTIVNTKSIKFELNYN